MTAFPRLGKPLARLDRKKRPAAGSSSRPQGVRFSVARNPNYARIKADVLQAIAQMSSTQQAQIPLDGTLPEIMIAYALVKLGLLFQWQSSEMGGRLRAGGAVVDFKVWVGGTITIVRVQGDHWHSLPERQFKDVVQWDRLHREGFRVWDAWELDCYRAWADGRFLRFVEEGILNAA